jgi:hypothetical protein
MPLTATVCGPASISVAVGTPIVVGSAGGYTDLDFANFVQRGGGENIFTSAELEAGNNLVVRLKASGLWAKMIGFYPFLGRAETPCRQNLKGSAYPLTFGKDNNLLTFGWSFASWGARGDGFGAFADTGFSPLTGWPEYASGIRTGSFGLDILQDGTNAVFTDVFTSGTGRAGASGALLFLRPTTSFYALPGWTNSGAGSSSFTTPASVIGTWLVTQSNDPSTNPTALSNPYVTRTVYKNASVVTTAATQNYPSGSPSYTLDGNLRFGGNGDGTRQSNSNSSDRPMSCCFFGLGLTAAEATALYDIITKFKTDRQGSLPDMKIIGDGDSIMIGYLTYIGGLTGGSGSPQGALTFLVTKPGAFSNITNTNLNNYAVGGNTAAIVLSNYASNAHTLSGTANKYILWVGTNDINASVSNATIQSNMRSIWTKAKQDGFYTVAFTVLKRSSFTQGGAMDNQRIALNALIKADEGTYVDQVVDVDSVISYSMLNSTYFGDTDGTFLHPNDVGHNLIWTYVSSVLK